MEYQDQRPLEKFLPKIKKQREKLLDKTTTTKSHQQEVLELSLAPLLVVKIQVHQGLHLYGLEK